MINNKLTFKEPNEKFKIFKYHKKNFQTAKKLFKKLKNLQNSKMIASYL